MNEFTIKSKIKEIKLEILEILEIKVWAQETQEKIEKGKVNLTKVMVVTKFMGCVTLH